MPSRDYEKRHRGTHGTGRAELYFTVGLISGLNPFPSASEPKQSVYATPEIAEEYPLTAVTRAPLSGSITTGVPRCIPQLREIVP